MISLNETQNSQSETLVTTPKKLRCMNFQNSGSNPPPIQPKPTNNKSNTIFFQNPDQGIFICHIKFEQIHQQKTQNLENPIPQIINSLEPISLQSGQ